MAHRVDGVLVGYPIATPSLRISTQVPRNQRAPGPNSLGPVCPVPTVPSTAWVDLTIADADNDEVYLDVPGYENYFAEDALPLIDEEAKEEEESVLSSSAASSSEASASASDDDDASTGSSSYESYTASSASYSGASDDDSAGAAWAAGAAGAGAAAAGAGTAYAAGGHSAELDYNGPELAHSAELDYQGGSNEMV